MPLEPGQTAEVRRVVTPELTADVLAAGNVESFVSRRSVAVARTVKAVKDMTEGGVTVSRLSVSAGLLADLAKEG